MRHALTICLVLLLAGMACAQQTQPSTISLSLSDIDITEAFGTLSQKGNVSILGDTTVKGKVSCSLSGVSAEQALDTICKMNKMEWYKTYAAAGTPDEKLSATKLFKLLDALKDLGGSAVICSDPKTKTQTVYIPNAAAVDTSTVATGLKLKEVYLVRAIPEPAQPKSADDKTKPTLSATALGDPAAAATQVWDYFKQMPMDQQLETMNQVRHKFYESMTPEQRDQMRNYFRQQYGNRDGQPRPDGQGGHGHGN